MPTDTENNCQKVGFYTLGCKVNQYESNGMIQKFKEAGYEVVAFEDYADIYIVNTCSVTNVSEKKSRQAIRKARNNNKDALIVAVGCYAQIAEKELEGMSEIDIILGTNEKNNIIDLIEKYVSSVSNIMQQREYLDFGSVSYTENTRVFIKIQDGCDRFCSYCIIPYARGRSRSRDLESIIKEVKQVVENGVQEVVITGIHIASYKTEGRKRRAKNRDIANRFA